MDKDGRRIYIFSYIYIWGEKEGERDNFLRYLTYYDIDGFLCIIYVWAVCMRKKHTTMRRLILVC